MESNAFMLYPTIDEDGYSLFDSPSSVGTPERKLLVAVLERAILDYVGNDPREVEESTDWIFGEIDDPDPDAFSFVWLCRELDLDPKAILDKVKAMPKRGKNRIAPWYFMKNQAACAS